MRSDSVAALNPRDALEWWNRHPLMHKAECSELAISQEGAEEDAVIGYRKFGDPITIDQRLVGRSESSHQNLLTEHDLAMRPRRHWAPRCDSGPSLQPD